jgi:hypothetical protein
MDSKDIVFGKVLELHRLLLNRDKEAYRRVYKHCEFDDPIVICKWFDDNEINLALESEVRLASKAALILYEK